MKKIFMYTIAACASLVLASCNGDYDDWTDPQSYAEGNAITIPGYQISNPVTTAIDLAAQPSDSVRLFTISQPSTPQGVKAEKNTITITPTGEGVLEGALAKTIICDDLGRAAVADLQAAVEQAYGKRPVARQFAAQVYSRANLNGNDALIDAGAFTLLLIPATPHIAPNYYVVGGMLDWAESAKSKAQKFQHSGKDVYEDPIFTITIPTSGDIWFAIGDDEGCDAITNDGVWNKLFGTTGKNEDLSGHLEYRYVLGGDYTLHAVTPDAKYLKIVLNMMERTYEITPLASLDQKLYVVGNPQGWSDSNRSCLFYPLGGGKYCYTTKWTNQWDLKIWDSENFGNWDAAWGSVVDGSTDASGKLINSGAQAFGASTSGGWYTLTIDMNAESYEWTAIDTPTKEYNYISLIGGFNGWGADVDLQQLEKAPHNWYVHYYLDEDTELKFRANHEWNGDWGSDGSKTIDSETFYMPGGSSNIKVAAGSYDFYFNDITGNWAIVASEK